ncbi:hypothetical protein, partial [Sphingobacterium spiritivorum]|uniref:hypothetical protein n=1 Tax=Sphingobacterium spiritivorum TaxID=258 RepID=UPI003DA38F64
MQFKKDFYLCHPLRELSRAVSNSDREVKKEEKSQKIFSQIFWSFKKDFYLCSPFRNEGKNKMKKQAQ